MKEYKTVENGTAYGITTPQAVIDVLEKARYRGQRIRLFYGYQADGIDWCEENDTIGTLGRSSGDRKVNILLASSRSTGGGAILDECIVRISCKYQRGAGIDLYRHPKYKVPEFTIKGTEDCSPFSLAWRVHRSDKSSTDWCASFESEKKARAYVAFMRGERWSK